MPANQGLSDEIRKLVRTKYVRPAVVAGKQTLAIRVRDILDDLEAQGLPGPGHTPQICSALRTRKFLRENNLEITKVAGPPSGQSPTVVVHYRLVERDQGTAPMTQQAERRAADQETPEEWAHRMTGKLYGLLKEEITGMGGTEAFMRWVRSDDEGSAPEDAA